SPKLASFGEGGLAGEVRAVTGASQRIAELQRLGFERCIVPSANLKGLVEESRIQLIPAKDIQAAIRACFD
ncbi:MAG: DNA repair protein RadA, partial [Clostridia bacterium]|nr:DNA repair protein RadA [Clostridia bacterium]